MNYLIEPYKRYFQIRGRASRAQYSSFTAWQILILILLGVLIHFLPQFSKTIGIIVNLFLIASFIPMLTIGIRRLHDLDRSGWLMVLAFIPLINLIFFLVLLLHPGTKGENRFGEEPKAITDWKIIAAIFVLVVMVIGIVTAQIAKTTYDKSMLKVDVVEASTALKSIAGANPDRSTKWNDVMLILKPYPNRRGEMALAGNRFSYKLDPKGIYAYRIKDGKVVYTLFWDYNSEEIKTIPTTK
ncbi:MAG: DUF805 domain-containing protein [Elusimicrobiota bacterium]|jgi:uncharacterized membrane protein YhaH (DUF805 family)|nr:DUF805 domain-containing protein [Elusimicrobiota bacterium]